MRFSFYYSVTVAALFAKTNEAIQLGAYQQEQGVFAPGAFNNDFLSDLAQLVSQSEARGQACGAPPSFCDIIANKSKPETELKSPDPKVPMPNRNPATKPPHVVKKGPLKFGHSFLHVDDSMSSSGWSASDSDGNSKKNKYGQRK